MFLEFSGQVSHSTFFVTTQKDKIAGKTLQTLSQDRNRPVVVRYVRLLLMLKCLRALCLGVMPLQIISASDMRAADCVNSFSMLK